VGGLDAIYVRTPDWEEHAKGMMLSPERTELIGLLERELEVETLCGASQMSDFQVCQTLWALRVIGIARRVDAPVAGAALGDDEGLGFVLPQE